MPLLNQNKNQLPVPERNPEYTHDPKSLTLKGVLSPDELTENLWLRNCKYAEQRLEQVPIELDYFLDSVERSEGLTEFITEQLAVLKEQTETKNGELSYEEVQNVVRLLEDWPKNILEASINLSCISKYFSWPNSRYGQNIHEVSLQGVENETGQKRIAIAFIALASRELTDGVLREQSYFVRLLGLAPIRKIY